MKFHQKKINRLPLEKLWDSKTYLEHKQQGYLAPEEVRKILSSQSVACVIAAMGAVPEHKSLHSEDPYWIEILQPRLADPEGVSLEDFPGGYAFFVSEWINGTDRILLFEMQH